MARRRPNMHTVGSFFSTDAGGRPGAGLRGMGTTEGVPPINIPGYEDFIGQISALQVGYSILTPWGVLVPGPSAMGYQVRPLSAPPDTNILAFDMSAVAQLLSSLGYGQPGFLALVSTTPVSPSAVDAALMGTPYKAFGEGLSVYSQADQGGIPSMMFLYWAVLRDPGDTSGGSGGMGVAAQSIGASLVFAQQVPVEQTTQRPVPTMNVTSVAELQFPMEMMPPAGATAPMPGGDSGGGEPLTTSAPAPGPAPPAPASASMVGPLLLGAAAAVVGVLVTRKKGRR